MPITLPTAAEAKAAEQTLLSLLKIALASTGVTKSSIAKNPSVYLKQLFEKGDRSNNQTQDEQKAILALENFYKQYKHNVYFDKGTFGYEILEFMHKQQHAKLVKQYCAPLVFEYETPNPDHIKLADIPSNSPTQTTLEIAGIEKPHVTEHLEKNFPSIMFSPLYSVLYVKQEDRNPNILVESLRYAVSFFVSAHIQESLERVEGQFQ